MDIAGTLRTPGTSTVNRWAETSMEPRVHPDDSPRSPSDRDRALEATLLLKEALALLEPRHHVDIPSIRRTPDKLLRLPDVQRVTGLRRSSIYEQMKAGTFPQSVKIGRRAITWSEAAIQAWISERLTIEPRVDQR